MSIRAIFNSWVNGVGEIANQQLKSRSFSVRKCILHNVLGLFAGQTQEGSPLERLSTSNQTLWVQTLSLLEQEIAEPIIHKYTQPLPILGYIHGDALVMGTPLENSLSFKTSLQVWIGYLECSQFPIPPSLLSCLKQLQQLCTENSWFEKDTFSAAEALSQGKVSMNAVYQLRPDDLHLMVGRCVDSQKPEVTYPILFEFKKESEQSYFLTVYLIAKEAAPFQVTIENQKRWINPVMEIRNISPVNLFFNDEGQPIQSDFFQAILETHITEFSAEAMILKLLKHLLESTHTDFPSVTMKDPESNTEMWRIFKALAKKHLREKWYQLAMAEMKVYSLVEGYQLYKKYLTSQQPAVQTLRTLLKTGALNTYSRLQELAKTDWIEGEILKTWGATVLDLITQLEQIEKIEAFQLQSEPPLSSELPQLGAPSIRAEKWEELRVAPIEASGLEAEQISTTLPRYLIFALPASVKSLPVTLKKWFDQRWGNKAIYAWETEQVIEMLPIPFDSNNYWADLPDAKLLPLIEIFSLMLDKYDLSTKKMVILPRTTNTVLSLYVLIHYLAVKIDANHKLSDDTRAPLKLYPLYSPGEEDDLDPFLLLSPQEFEKRMRLRKYFEKPTLIVLN